MSRISWIAFLVLNSFCAAQVLTIRVVDTRTGHALPKEQVSVSLLYAKGEAVPPKYDAIIHLETDSNGDVRVSLPEPVPIHIAVQVTLTSEHWRCGCGVLATTQDVIQSGIVGPQPGSRPKDRIAPTKSPGVILILARPLTFWERLLYPLVKQ